MDDRRHKLFWLFANAVVLAMIVLIVWTTLLPAIWGPNDDALSEFGERRTRTERRR